MSRYLTPRTVFVIVKFWTIGKYSSTYSPEINDDKHCPRCQLPTHVLTILIDNVCITFYPAPDSYLFTIIEILGSQFLNQHF